MNRLNIVLIGLVLGYLLNCPAGVSADTKYQSTFCNQQYADRFVIRYSNSDGSQYACEYSSANERPDERSCITLWQRNSTKSKWSYAGSHYGYSYGASFAAFKRLPSGLITVCVETVGFTRNILECIAIPKNIASYSYPLLSQWHESNVQYHYNKNGFLTGFTLGYLVWHIPDVEDKSMQGHILACRSFMWDQINHNFLAKPYRPDVVGESKLTLPEVLETIGSDTILGIKKHETTEEYTSYSLSPVGILKSKVPAEFRNSKKLLVEINKKSNQVSSYQTIL